MKNSRKIEKLSMFNSIEAVDPEDGETRRFDIVGTYLDKEPNYSEGLRLQRVNGSIFESPSQWLELGTEK